MLLYYTVFIVSKCFNLQLQRLVTGSKLIKLVFIFERVEEREKKVFFKNNRDKKKNWRTCSAVY